MSSSGELDVSRLSVSVDKEFVLCYIIITKGKGKDKKMNTNRNTITSTPPTLEELQKIYQDIIEDIEDTEEMLPGTPLEEMLPAQACGKVTYKGKTYRIRLELSII